MKSVKNLVPVFLVVFFIAIACYAQVSVSENLQQSLNDSTVNENNSAETCDFKKITIAGLNVAEWLPANMKTPVPLVIFSHGYGGVNVQSKFIMKAFADAGYLVLAPNHKDSFANKSRKLRPEVKFQKPSQWHDTTYKNRHDDIVALIDALKQDSEWQKRIDWSKLVLCGHSLGGYTVLGLGGAWPSWKIEGIKAIIALSPVCEPFILNGDLSGIKVPVMYQGGNRDFKNTTPNVSKPDGAFDKTSAPAYYVEFDKVNHFGWTNLNANKAERALINFYCLSFLDKYVKDNASADPSKNLAGVVDIRTK